MRLRIVQGLLIGLPLLFILYVSLKSDFKEITIATPNGNTKIFVKVAQSPQDFRRGLMFINYLPKRHGMIFLHSSPTYDSFWMHNTFISLDILFIDEYGEIFQIYNAAKPMDKTILPSMHPCKYIVELRAGEATSLGITEHSKLILTKDID